MQGFVGARLRTFVLERMTNPDFSFPRKFFLETSSVCNLRCPSCVRTYSERPRTHMQESTFQTVVQEISRERPDIEHVGLHFFGEPLLNPRFFDLVEIARRHLPNTTLAVSSNANLLSSEKIDLALDSGLDSLGIWPDATSPDIYDNIRPGGNLKKVENAIRELLERRGKRGREDIEVHVGAILYKNNMSFLKEFLERWTAICSKYRNAHVFVGESHDWAGQVPADTVINSARRGIIHVKAICPVPFETCVVSAQGDVTPCCYDCNLRLAWGNIRNASIREMWTGEKARKLRERLLTGRVTPADLCYTCHIYRQSLSSLLRSSIMAKMPGIGRIFRKEYDKYYRSRSIDRIHQVCSKNMP